MLTMQLALNFAAYFGTTLALWAVAVLIYVRITPYDEFALIRSGNVAAACSLGGTALGLALPLASLAVHAVSLLDLLVWAVVALLAQLALWALLRATLLKELSSHIVGDRVSVGLTLGVFSAGVGLLNATCLSY